MRLLLTGSAHVPYTDAGRAFVREIELFILQLPPDVELVVRGSWGADRIAEEAAQFLGLNVTRYIPRSPLETYEQTIQYVGEFDEYHFWAAPGVSITYTALKYDKVPWVWHGEVLSR